MSKRILTLAALAAWAGNCLAAGETKPETADVLAWPQFVGNELRELRRELLQDSLERQQNHVRDLEREHEQARVKRQQTEDLQRSQGQEMLQLEQRLRDPSAPAEERAQWESLRAEISARTPAMQAAAAKEDAQLGDSLRMEQGRLQSLRNLERSLAPPSTAGQAR